MAVAGARRSTRNSIDPDASAWSKVEVVDAHRHAVLLVRDEPARPGDQRLCAILARPALETDPAGAPRLSVTFHGRIERATIDLDLTVAPEPWMLSRLPGARALSPCEGLFRIAGSSTTVSPLAESTVTDGRLDATLSASLDRAAALELLAALRGESNGLEATVTLVYRDSATDTTATLYLSTDLARIHARLAPLARLSPVFYERDLESHLAALIESGGVSVEGACAHLDASAGAQHLAQASLDAFLRACSLYVERLADDPRTPALGRRFLLRGPAPASMPLRVRVALKSTTNALARVVVRVPLHELLCGCLDRKDPARLVHFTR